MPITNITNLSLHFQIGRFSFSSPFVLAPMAGVTDRVFRQLCRQQGVGYAVGEMVASQKQLWDSAKSSTRRADKSEPEPRIVQLLGTDPQLLAEAAAFQVAQGAQIIDLNLGCPAKKVCSVAAGSALMGNPKTVAEIFQAVVSAVEVPVTVKMRTGLDAEHKNALQIAQLAEDCGLQAVTIHGRTRADKFQGQAEYDTIAEVKQQLKIPVIANGDIRTPEQAEFVLKYTQADGVMIGRSSLGFPWIFQQCLAHQQGLPIQQPNWEAFIDTMYQHVQGLHQLYGEVTGVRHARKHIGWYGEKIAELAQQAHLSLPTNHSPADWLRHFRRTFNRLETAQAQLDFLHICNPNLHSANKSPTPYNNILKHWVTKKPATSIKWSSPKWKNP